jgi:thioredoxin 2
MSANPRQIVCPHCAVVNRVPAEKPAKAARCGKCHEALFNGRSAPVDGAGFDRQIGRNDIPVVVDFWADWCGPCHMMAPAFEKMAARFEPNARFLKLDTEKSPEISARFGIRGIPTLMVFKGGKLVAQQAGAVGEQALAGWLAPHIGDAV